MRGSNVCRLPGGKAPQVRRAAARRIAQDEARRMLGVPSEVDPGEALLGQVHEAAGNVEALRWIVLEAEGADAADHPVLPLYNAERDRLARFAKLALDAGVAERQVRMAERQGELVVQALLAALADREWGLSLEAQDLGRRVIARHLRAISEVASIEAA